jgi:hypothetical protein
LLDTRVLYQSANGDGYWVRAGGGTPQNIATSAGSSTVRLTSNGVILLANGVASEWRDGILTPLTVGGRVDTLEVRGSFALWRETGGAQPGVYRRDLKAGTTQLMAPGLSYGSLASNGDVVSILPSGEMQWLHAGNVVTVPNDLGATQRFRAVTDGVHLAYLATTSASRACPCSLVVFSNGVTTTVADNLSVDARYMVAGGWLAVHRPGPTPDVYHVWSRAPDGTLRQVDQFTEGAFPIALTESGTLVFSGGPGPHLYASAPPYATSKDAGTVVAQVLVRDDKIIKLIGRSAFVLR